MYTYDLLNIIKSNRFNYNQEAQKKDIDLFFQYLRCKYNKIEFEEVIIKIKNKLK